MPEFFRVRDKSTKHEYSVVVVDEELHELLEDEPALDASGAPLPAKLHFDDEQPAPPTPGTVVVDETAGDPVADEKPASRKPAGKKTDTPDTGQES